MKYNQSTHLPGIFESVNNLNDNCLFYGDNLTIMRSMPPRSIDLIYLDPPFNSQRNYNLIYKKLTGLPVPEQEEAFCDAWEMDAEKEHMVRNMPVAFEEYGADKDLIEFWKTCIQALRHTQPQLLAYLVYMSYRLFEMKRILKSTGSLYLHCDPTASHYIKVILDGIFGHSNFRNEIVWQRTSSHNDSRKWGSVHDTILFYSKSNQFTWNPVYTEHDEKYVADFYRHEDERGVYRLDHIIRSASMGARPNLAYEYKGYTPEWGWRVIREKLETLDADGRLEWSKTGRPYLKRYLHEQKGTPIKDIITDIPPIGAQSNERLGYPTQKPIPLLQRIIQASSNPGDVVFDPFAGCGTAIYAAHLQERKWIGCDIAILSVQLVRDVLEKRYGLKEGEHYRISGVPVSIEGAYDLLSRDSRQFQHWAVELAGGFSSTKHSGDLGIDGRIHFETQDGLKNLVISVKGGKLTPAFMRELHGVLEREESSELGGLICLQEPTKGIISEAASAGQYYYQGVGYDRLQIRTVSELLEGRSFHTPSRVQTLNWVKQPRLPL